MKLRNNKSVPFLGKNLPKRQKRKATKTSIESKTEVLPKPIIVEVESRNHDPTPPSSPDVPPYSTNSPPKEKAFVAVGNSFELIPSSSESDSSEPFSDQVELVEQSSNEEDSKVNNSLRRFSRGTPRSTRRSQLNSTLNKPNYGQPKRVFVQLLPSRTSINNHG